MNDISKQFYHRSKIDSNGKLLFSNQLKPGQNLALPAEINAGVVKKNIRLLTMFAKKRVNMAIDVTHIHLMEYDEWLELIKLASKYNFKFKVNEFVEYNADEMFAYVEKFTREINGKRTFVFDVENFMLANNPLTHGREGYGEDLEEKSKQCILNIDADRFNVAKYVRDISKTEDKTIVFDMYTGETFDDDKKKKVMKIVDYVRKHYKNEKFDFTFNTIVQYYNRDEFDKIIDVEEYIKETYNPEYTLRFSGAGKYYTKNKILDVNSKITGIVNNLKESNISPYEKIIYVHKLLSELEYVKSDDNDNLSRNVYGVLTTRNIVCVGYAALFNAIFEELNDENIKVKMETIEEKDYVNDSVYHAINCIYVKDDKYNIEGYYNLDSCYNSGTDNLRNFMIPTKDFQYAYANKGKKVKKIMLSSRGTLLDQTLCFEKTDGVISKSKFVVGQLDAIEKVINGKVKCTMDFLNTDLGNECSKSINHRGLATVTSLLKTIDMCVDKTQPIELDKTYSALKEVAKKMYGMSEKQSEKYAESLMVKTAFESIFFFRREECCNSFCKLSEAIESGDFAVENNKKQVRNQWR